MTTKQHTYKIKHKANPPKDWQTQDEETTEDVKTLRTLGLQPENRCVLFTVRPAAIVDLAGMFRGRHAFLICGGPSLKELDLTQLDKRGVLTMGVNNSWLAHKPNLWCGVDPAFKFVDTCWKDSTIMKFYPVERYKEKLHVKKKDGDFKFSRFSVCSMPNVWYFRRRSVFDHRTFLTWPSFSWGCHKKVVDSVGWSGCRSVMLPAIRLLHYLGVKHVYIIGADFSMEEQLPGKDKVENYAWNQFRQPSSVGSNNRTYKALNARLESLVPIFNAAKFYVWNATPGGNLDVLPRLDFDLAIDRASSECGKPVDTDGWYNHKIDLKTGKTEFITK